MGTNKDKSWKKNWRQKGGKKGNKKEPTKRQIRTEKREKVFPNNIVTKKIKI